MLTFLNSKSLWIGTDLKRFNQIRDALDTAHIAYKIKINDQMGQWAGKGTLQGQMGSIGNKSEISKEYEILVHKNDFEQAEYIRCKMTSASVDGE